MGPTMAELARRAALAANHHLEIIAASRFSDPKNRSWLEARGIKTVQADLLRRGDVAALPDSGNVIYLAGLKFGTSQNPAMTWAVNTLAPAHVAERYALARIVALSTGNVYPHVPVASGGSVETDPLSAWGEYASAAIARERLFEYFSLQNTTSVALIRLNYAVELRYGVLVDVARKVWLGEPVDVSNGFLNCLWQGDANELILRSLKLATHPAEAWNLTGKKQLKVREVAENFSKLLDRPLTFIGEETETALLSNVSKLSAKLGEPETPTSAMIEWIAQWVKAGGRFLGKPTRFEVRDGVY